MIAYPVLLISMAFFAYGNSNYNTIDIFTITVINNDLLDEENPEFARNETSIFFCDAISSKEYQNTLIIEGINIHVLETAIDLLNSLRIDAIVVINEYFSEALYKSPTHEDKLPIVDIITKDNILILAELSLIVVEIVNSISFNITGAPEAEIQSATLGGLYFDYTLFDLLIPGIIIGSLSICMSLLAIAIAKEKESRRMHRLMTTPVKRRTIITSIVITQIITAIIQFFIAVLLSQLLGTHALANVNWNVIFFIAMLYNLSSMGMGLILASFVKSARNAALISFIITFTMMMIGENYTIPGEMAGSAFIPNTYAVDAVRNIMLFGRIGWDIIGFDIIFLSLFGMTTLIIGLVSFNRKYAMT